MDEHTSTMPPNIAAFFSRALPKGQGEHVLALGEHHRHGEHIKFLDAHLAEIIERSYVGTIGIEAPTYMNVFLWAYADGSLTRKFGSAEKAKQYLLHMFVLSNEAEYESTIRAQVDLVTKAIDMGVRVVAFDARHVCQDEMKDYGDEIKQVHKQIVAKAADSGLSRTAFREKMFQDESVLKSFMDDTVEAELQAELKEEGSDVVKQLAKHSGYESIEDYRDKGIRDDVGLAVMFHELERWIKRKPNYEARLNVMDSVIFSGRKLQQHVMPCDALSATILNATKVPNKNVITLNGFGHIDGIGFNEENPYFNVHGAFHRHVELAQPEGGVAPKVTRAVVASTSVGSKIHQDLLNERRSYQYLLRETDAPILLALDSDMVKSMQMPNPRHPKLVSLEYKVSAYHSSHHRHSSGAKSCVNPLLISTVKQAYDDVFADWNPGLAQGQQR